MKRLQESLYSDERAKDPGTVATILMLSLCDVSTLLFACHNADDCSCRLEDLQVLVPIFSEQNA